MQAAPRKPKQAGACVGLHHSGGVTYLGNAWVAHHIFKRWHIELARLDRLF